jgi:hypothetical protein
MKKTALLVLFSLLSFSTIRSFAAHITTDYDHSADFAQYKTYTWLKVQAEDSLWADRIKRDVNAQLAAKGWTEVNSNASATIAAFRSTQNQQSLETFYDGFGGGWRWRGFGGEGMSTTTTDITKVGTLVVDIFDSKTQKLLWRGKESNDLSSKPEENEKSLAKDIASMFKRFPPSN